ncbi:MAG: D-2-hydroxyacid dehydrogenase [Bacillota bacterium]|nr:D-2-hydroxyacid dehydrogenase [Bacillota bacterium]
MLKILANDGMDKSAVSKLEKLGHSVDTNHYEGDELVAKMKEVDVIIIRSATKIRKDLIDKVVGGNLKLMVRAGVGIDNIDHEYAEEKGFAVRNTPKSGSAAVAELVLAHMFAIARFIGISNVSMRAGEWNKKQYNGIELYGKTLGIIGMGRIGYEVAKRAKALGMDVIYNKRSGACAEYGEFTFASFEDVLKKSDFISIHTPLDKNAGAVIKSEQFDMMKDGVVLINAARGGVVCEKCLLDALNSGKLMGAGIDVFAEEPTKNMDLVNHPKVSVTPHIGAQTKEAQSRIGKETLEVVLGHFKG